jgi:hypothetical protein
MLVGFAVASLLDDVLCSIDQHCNVLPIQLLLVPCIIILM